MEKFSLFWLTGAAEVVQGTDIADALTSAGYGAGAVAALDFHSKGDITEDYVWDKGRRKWVSVTKIRVFDNKAVDADNIRLRVEAEIKGFGTRETFMQYNRDTNKVHTCDEGFERFLNLGNVSVWELIEGIENKKYPFK